MPFSSHCGHLVITTYVWHFFFNIDKCIQVCLVKIIANYYSCLLFVCCHFCNPNAAMLPVPAGAHLPPCEALLHNTVFTCRSNKQKAALFRSSGQLRKRSSFLDHCLQTPCQDLQASMHANSEVVHRKQLEFGLFL